MTFQDHKQRYLAFILISIIVMVIVMTLLLLGVYFWSPGSLNRSDANSPGASGVDSTVEALVATLLETTPTPFSKLGDADGNGTDLPQDQLTQTGTFSEDTPGMTMTPTESGAMVPSPTPTPSKTPIEWVESMMGSMTLRQKVGQMILTGVNGSQMTSETCQFIQRVSPGGIIYIGSNIASPYPDSLKALSNGLQDCIARSIPIPLFISIDHEGPYVNRFPGGSQMTIFPPAMAIGSTTDPNRAFEVANAAGSELRTNGVNMVLGPVADVLTNYNNTVISQRSFGGEPAAVGSMVSSAVQGYLNAGVLPVLKHYPGHGEVAGDSHDILPVDQADLSRLREVHLVPFQSGIGAGAPAVMVSHVAFPAIDPQSFPASLSAPLYQVLFEDLGFQGFAMSDSMGMGAVGTTGLGTGEASVKAVRAGLDMLMLVTPSLAESVYGTVLQAAQDGVIPEERINQAVRRILTVKYEHGLISFSPPDVPVPDWSKNQELAFDVGVQSVSLHKNEANLIPLSESVRSVLVVGPTDGWGLYPRVRSAFDQRGIGYNIMTYSGYWYGPVPETGYLQTVPARAPGYDLVIVFTWDAHPNRFRFDDSFQAQLVRNLLDGGFPTVVIALKSPTDVLAFPELPTYLASMGTTPGQIQAVLDTLLGKTTATGVIPLPNLP